MNAVIQASGLGKAYRRTRALRDCTLAIRQEVITGSHTDKQSGLLTRTDEPVLDPSWTVKPVSLEDLVLAYTSQAGDDTQPRRQRLGVVS